MEILTYNGVCDEYPLCADIAGLATNSKGAADLILERFGNKSIILLGSGTSGAMFMVMIAQHLKAAGRDVHCSLLRKTGEDTHRSMISRGYIDCVAEPAIFWVDDLICSGATLCESRKLMTDVRFEYDGNTHRLHKLTGIVLADEAQWTSRMSIENAMGDIPVEYLIGAHVNETI